MIIKKYNDYIKENANMITELDIREFLKQQTNTMIQDLLDKVSDKFPMNNIDYDNTQQYFDKLENIKSELNEIIIDIVIDNVKDFNKTWDIPEIQLGDIVIHKDTGEEYFVHRFGTLNNFYDEDKREYVKLTDVIKKGV